MTSPAVTVLMSCYNASKYLAEAVESVLCQTYQDWEFVVVDDGSSDSTLDIINRFAARDPRIVVVAKSNTGLADSLNIGMGVARGRWIARLDADDYALPDRLARQIAFVERNPSIVLLGSGCTLVDGRGKRIGDYRYPSQHQALVAHMAAGRSPFPHSSALFQREVAIRIGGYNRRFARCQDLDLWLRLAMVGEIASLSDVCVRIRKHVSNVSNDCTVASTMSMSAIVCHFIRSKGGSDPSQGDDDDAWTRFTNWLTCRMEEGAYIVLQNEWFKIRRGFQSQVASRGRLRAVPTLVRGLLRSGHVCRIIQNKLFGTKLGSQLADEWMGGHAQMLYGR